MLETTTEPVTETTTDTAPLIVTDPLASEELSSLTEQVDETPVGLVPSPTAEDVTTFTVQEQPDAPDEQPFVPITGVSPDLSVNQYLDTTYETGYPTTQGMEIKESLIPGQEYSAERLAAGQMMDVIKPDLGSGAGLPSVDFSNIGFDVDDDTEEVETELYEKPEFVSTDPDLTETGPNYADLPMSSHARENEITDPLGYNFDLSGAMEGTVDFLTNPLRGIEGLAINVADRIWKNRPAFFLATHRGPKGEPFVLDQNGKPIRRKGLGTLINRILDKMYEERPNKLFKEYINEGEELEGEVWGTLRDRIKRKKEVTDTTEAGQKTFLENLWAGLGAGLNMINPFTYLQSGQQQFRGDAGSPSRFPTTTPVVTGVNWVVDKETGELVPAGRVYDEEGNWTGKYADNVAELHPDFKFLGEIQGTNLTRRQRRDFNNWMQNLSDSDQSLISKARTNEYNALAESLNLDSDTGVMTRESPPDALTQLLDFLGVERKNGETTSQIPSVKQAVFEEAMKKRMAEAGYSEADVFALGLLAGDEDRSQEQREADQRKIMELEGYTDEEITNIQRRARRDKQMARAQQYYETVSSGGADEWGVGRYGAIDNPSSGFSSGRFHSNAGQGVQYGLDDSWVEEMGGPAGRGGWRGTGSIVAGTGRLPAAGGSWGGLNPFFEVPGPGDPMYADYLMDTLGPSKYQQNEIERMVAQTLPFFEAVGEDGKYYLMSKETGQVLYGPYDNPNAGGGGTSPGGGMAHGGPVVRNVGETEGIAGLFEDMMGPGRIDETERVYEYPGGTMTERVSRGSFNMRTG